MDGSNAAFLFDQPLSSGQAYASAGGILYIEDFDDEPSPEPDPAPPEPAPPSFTAAELDAAREAGRQEGLSAALADAQLVQAELQAAATQSVADGLAAARTGLKALADAHAGELSRTVLAVLVACVPEVMRCHAIVELQAMTAALAPGLACEPELRVRAHPGLADGVREMLIGVLPADTCVLAVCADATLAEGDVQVAWQGGRAKRDCAAVWSQVRTALEPLGLPTIEEVCHGRTC